MTIHLVKIAVGIESVVHLRKVQLARVLKMKGSADSDHPRHLTRNTPKRSEEVLDGGSIYWIIKGYIRVRQRITSFGAATGFDGKPRCALTLDPRLVQTVLVPHKPIQGWRYMEVKAAPADLTTAEKKMVSSLPLEMADELRALGLL